MSVFKCPNPSVYRFLFNFACFHLRPDLRFFFSHKNKHRVTNDMFQDGVNHNPDFSINILTIVNKATTKKNIILKQKQLEAPKLLP